MNDVLFTPVGRQKSGFEPSLYCFCSLLSPFFFWVSGLMGARAMYSL